MNLYGPKMLAAKCVFHQKSNSMSSFDHLIRLLLTGVTGVRGLTRGLAGSPKVPGALSDQRQAFKTRGEGLE